MASRPASRLCHLDPIVGENGRRRSTTRRSRHAFDSRTRSSTPPSPISLSAVFTLALIASTSAFTLPPDNGLDVVFLNQDSRSESRLDSGEMETRVDRWERDLKTGWLARWLAVGGEGLVTVQLAVDNFTLPHRPAAFPDSFQQSVELPLEGFLVPFASLLRPEFAGTGINHASDRSHGSEASYINYEDITSSKTQYTHYTGEDDIDGLHDSSTQGDGIRSSGIGSVATNACIPPTTLPRRDPPVKPYLIALIERGGCDFATKVRAAQDRGCAGVVVGDSRLRDGETDEEGRKRENLITMFSPEDTDNIFIPSVFVSRNSYLLLRDLLADHEDSGRSEGKGLWVELGRSHDEGSTLGSLLSFALLMPSLFLLATIGFHRVRLARLREADRAPAIVVLSLPERIWTPDIVWEKDSDSEGESPKSPHSKIDAAVGINGVPEGQELAQPNIPAPPSISARDIPTPPAIDDTIHAAGSSGSNAPIGPIDHGTIALDDVEAGGTSAKRPRKSSTRKYFGKDECAICMDMFQRGDVVRILPCGHVFHKEECDEWLLKWRKLCPTCRADVTLPPGDNRAGMTITPVRPPGHGAEEVLHRTYTQRATSALRSVWHKMSRRRIMLGDEVESQRAGE